MDTEAQFHISNSLKREQSQQIAQVAVHNYKMQSFLPTREQIVNDTNIREHLAKNLLMLKNKVTDSGPYWKRHLHDAEGAERYMETVYPWRSHTNEVPQRMMSFQTRALNYNHHPAIHRLCSGYTINKQDPDLDMRVRFKNSIENPSIISYMQSFMSEMDARYISPVRYDTDFFFNRMEWGSNGNPHFHSLKYSNKFSVFWQHEHNRLQSTYQAVLQTEKD